MRGTRSTHRRVRGGFTLIELLVVIAIIALLVSILLPSLNKAKELAKTVVCASGEKSTGLALAMYANAYGVYPVGDIKHHDGPLTGFWMSTIPYSAFEVDIPGYDGRWLPGTTLAEFVDDRAVFRCVSHDLTANEEKWEISSYAYNGVYLGGRRLGGGMGHYSPTAPGASPEDILNPAETVSVVESLTLHLSPPGYSDFLYHHGGAPWEDPRNGARWDHNEGMNALFADGHVDWHPSWEVDPDDDLSNQKNKLWNGTGFEVEPADDAQDW